MFLLKAFKLSIALQRSVTVDVTSTDQNPLESLDQIISTRLCSLKSPPLHASSNEIAEHEVKNNIPCNIAAVSNKKTNNMIETHAPSHVE